MFIGATAFTLGLLTGTHLSIPAWLLLLPATILLLSILLLTLKDRLSTLRNVLVISLFFLLGWLRWSLVPSVSVPEGQVWVKGVVQGNVERHDDRARFRLDSVYWQRCDEQAILRGDAIVYLDASDARHLHDGQQVRMLADIAPLNPRNNPGGFNECAYWGMRGVSYRVIGKSINGFETANPGLLAILPRSITSLRLQVINQLRKKLPAEQEPSAIALLTGQRWGWPEEFQEQLAASGMMHLFAISGLHTGILAGVLLLLLKLMRLPWRWAYAVSILLIWCYVPFTGSQPPVLRAALLYTFLAGGRALQRRYNPAYSLALAWIVLLFWRPWGLWDAGFQLSFAGTAGVLVAVRAFDVRLHTKRHAGKPWYTWVHLVAVEYLFGLLLVSVGAWLATAPVLIWHFGRLSLIGLPLMPLALPLVTLALIAGWVMILLGWIPFVGTIFTAAFTGIHTLLLGLAQLGAASGWVVENIPGLATWTMALFSLVGLVLFARIKTRPLATLSLLLVWAALMVVTTHLVWLNQPLRFIVANVGQGDGIVVCRGDRAVVVDGGPPGSRGVSEALRWYGVRHIPLYLVTHGDRDHAGVIPDLNGSLDVEAVVTSPVTLRDKAGEEGIVALGECGANLYLGHDGDTIRVAGIGRFILLNPPVDVTEETEMKDNDASLCILYQAGNLDEDGFSALLPGDIAMGVERDIVSRYPNLDIDILIAPHHGSKHSTSRELLESFHPEEVVISCGQYNPFSHPHQDVLVRINEAQLPVWRTDQQGAKVVVLDE